MNIVSALFVICFSITALAQGGASTVGDGGHGVDCKNKNLQLLDLYEFAHGKHITLPDSQSERESFPILLARASAALHLSSNETHELQLAAKRFFRFRIDPWQMGLKQFSHFLDAKAPAISRLAIQRMEDENCDYFPIVVRPDQNARSLETYQYLCSLSHAGIKHCFLVHDRSYRKLSRPQRACLVLHEALRFLPKTKRLSETELRAFTARICTQ